MNEVLRLFLVEDDDATAVLIRKSLERVGHHVTRCRSAADALIVLGHSTFDVVLLDQRLPDMAGLDFLEALAREGIDTPALMVTASGDEELATRVLQAGALDYIVKDPGLNFLAELPKRVEASVARHRLQLTNRLLIGALESARDGIMITDLQGKITHVNRALERMTGYARSELLGQNPRILKDERNPSEIYAELWRTILARGSWQGELSNRRKDGSTVEISLTVSPIMDNRGQLTHFVAIHREMTERKFLERQLLQAQKMQSVGTLAGGVSHEFNNLLAGINGYAALGLREANLSEPVRMFLQHIVDLSERAAGLTRQLLAYARKPAVVRRPTDPRDLMRTTAELVTRTLRVEVVADVLDVFDRADALTVDADANQLQQALVNLALNARDAGTGGKPITFRLREVHLKAEKPSFPESVPAGDFMFLEVVDSGCGMTPEVLNQALDPFFTTKPVGKGTGLGLPMVFGIVHGHQGFLSIDSIPGKGTSVGIYLPLRASKPLRDNKFDFELGQIVEPEAVPGRTILVLDDEEAVRDVVRRFLEIAGHHVICAATGQEAVTLMSGNCGIDLIILDLLMPPDDGFGIFQQLHRQRPEIPILLCTGLLSSDSSRMLTESGRVAMIHKPFRMNELWYAVNEALATKVET
jgi:PAS domain S-box-containing protein